MPAAVDRSARVDCARDTVIARKGVADALPFGAAVPGGARIVVGTLGLSSGVLGRAPQALEALVLGARIPVFTCEVRREMNHLASRGVACVCGAGDAVVDRNGTPGCASGWLTHLRAIACIVVVASDVAGIMGHDARV